jgi:ATP-dependent Lhr-like helicase
VLEALRQHGAMFFDELAHDARLLRAELEIALGELVGDGAGQRRQLCRPARDAGAGQQAQQMDKRRRGAGPTMEEAGAGRWCARRRRDARKAWRRRHRRPEGRRRGAAQAAHRSGNAGTHRHDLLRRYGVMFWRLLEREAAWLPAWRELLPVYHRLEARGEIRGGRFVAGLAGEQFALPEAIPAAARSAPPAARRQPGAVSGVDPLNLCGTLLPGDKVPALASNRLVYRDGIPVAAEIAGKPQFWGNLEPEVMTIVRDKLIRH